MIKIEKTEVLGWEPAIRGMRNPMNSWEKSDSGNCMDASGQPDYELRPYIGSNDRDLMLRLAQGGPVHAKYRRMIVVYADITAPLYWWKEFDTYKVGTVANSCSTMHKIAEKPFTLEDFSYEYLIGQGDRPKLYASMENGEATLYNCCPMDLLKLTCNMLNFYRECYLEVKEQHGPKLDKSAKDFWWQMIQLLPSSYNQKRTVMMNYEVLAGIYPMRKDHKLDEWHVFCDWIESLPYSELIIGNTNKEV